MPSPRLAERYGMIWRSKKSRSAISESASVATVAFAGVAIAIGWAIVATGGFSPGTAADAAIGVGGATDFGSTAGGATPVIFSVPAGTGAPSGTRAVGVPIVSGGLASSGRGGGTFSSGFFSGAAIVSAVIVDPTTLFARAVGVLKSAAVEAIGADPAVITFSALGAGAPASGFVGGVGLNESRIFAAAATSWARMCGICS